jgi:tetratricopeptide (TPR) repeat protein
MDDDSIPGLDDVVEAIGSTSDEDESAELLPFGMGAKAEVLDSALPFGVGSFGQGVEVLAIPASESEKFEEIDDLETPIHVEVDDSQDDDFESFEIEEADEIYDDELDLEKDYSESPFEVNNPVDVTTISNAEPPLVVEVKPLDVVRLNADDEDKNKPVDDSLLTTVNLEETSDLISDEVPDMWRIDAAEVDLDDIYSQEEQVIEVSFDDDLGSGDVNVTFDEFHHAAVEDSMASDDDAPELHPARALATDAQGQPEVAQMVENAFSHLGESAWLEAAQVLSAASSLRQNDPTILNNLGLALLQSALEMDSLGDPMSSSQYEAAIMALRQGAKIEPENNTLLLNLGHALLVSGRAEKALGVINVVRGRDSANVEVENALGACLIQLGRDEEAESILTPYANDRIVSANIALI